MVSVLYIGQDDYFWFTFITILVNANYWLGRWDAEPKVCKKLFYIKNLKGYSSGEQAVYQIIEDPKANF